MIKSLKVILWDKEILLSTASRERYAAVRYRVLTTMTIVF